MDSNGILHFYSRHSYSETPCITPTEMATCLASTLGADFDLGRRPIRTLIECDQTIRFERCLKSAIFNQSKAIVIYNYDEAKAPSFLADNCNLEERENSLEVLRGMFRFEIAAREDSANCHTTRDHWAQSNFAMEQKQLLAEDSASRMTDTLKWAYQCEWEQVCNFDSELTLSVFVLTDIKPLDCYSKTLADDELCLTRFEKRTRALWSGQGVERTVPWDEEVNSMCW